MSRLFLEHSIFTYLPGDDQSHQEALQQAKAFLKTPNLHPELVITEMNSTTIRWFLEALEQLGVRDLDADLMEQIDIFLEAA